MAIAFVGIVLSIGALGGTAFAQTNSGTDGGTPNTVPTGTGGTGGVRGDQLSMTGASIWVLVITGVALVALGTMIVASSRREHEPA
jgi:hypothetical protein